MYKRTNEINDFLTQRVNFAVVVNCELETVERIKRFLVETDIRIIYQKTSLQRLYIKEGETQQ